MIDWDALRRRSLQPHGFGSDRVHIWPRLLNVKPTSASSGSDEPHRDEHQIKLDTARSFVLYPHTPTDTHRTQLQSSLHSLIVSLFRARPKLSYFQGYHDIISVILLTLPEEVQFAAAEKLSLHRLRDSMGTGLEPVLGLLRVTKNLIRLADPEMASMLEQSSQLPFFALSNLLTLFSHDMPTLPLIQHVFDYLLCRPPIAVVYLAATIILARKEEVRRLQEEDEEGMIHSLLSSLPEFVDEPEEEARPSSPPEPTNSPILNGSPPTPPESRSELDDSDTTIVATPPSPGASRALESESEGIFSPPPDSDLTLLDTPEPPEPPNLHKANGTLTPNDDDTNGHAIPETKHDSDTTVPTTTSESIPSPTPSPSPPPTQSRPHSPSPTHSRPPSPHSTSPSPPPTRPHLSLPALLTHADNLYTLYPPSHPSLSLSQIMGPQSTIFTWSENPHSLPSDTTAESMVTRPDLIVYPHIPSPPPSEYATSDDDESSYEEARSASKRGKRRRTLKKSEKAYRKAREKQTNKKKERRRFRSLVDLGVGVERKAMVAGAVVVLGIAMAVYSVKTKPFGGGAAASGGGSGSGGGGFGVFGKAGRHWPWSW